jgi:serine/threonine-protein kinase
VGTLSYISPEQLAGDADVSVASDVYSLACVVYEMLCGEPPFRGLPQQVIQGHLSGTPRPLQEHVRDLPESADACVRCALAKVPRDRHTTATEFVQELFRCCEGAPAPLSKPVRGWWPFRS